MRRLYIGGVAALLLAFGAASPAAAAQVVTQAAGPNAAAITPAVNEFGNALGALNGGGPAAPSGRRRSSGTACRRTVSRRRLCRRTSSATWVHFATPTLGAAFQVSGVNDFANLNASYATAFDAFSPPRVFAPIGSTSTDTTFVVPGSDTEAETNGFGVVFSDVDLAGSSSIEFFDPGGDSLGSVRAQAGNANATFSFLGVRFDAGERIDRARITSGAAPLLAAASPNDLTQGGPADLVVMDDFIYGEPLENAPPEVTVRGAPRSIRLTRLLRRGIRLRLTPNEPVSFRGMLLASVRRVRVARNELTLVTRRLGQDTGTRSLRLRPKRRFLQDTPRRFRIRLVLEATDAGSLTTTVRRTIRVRR